VPVDAAVLGTMAPGVVTSVVSEDEVKALKQAYFDLEINDFMELEELPATRVRDRRRDAASALLDDLFFFMETNADVVNASGANFRQVKAAVRGTSRMTTTRTRTRTIKSIASSLV